MIEAALQGRAIAVVAFALFSQHAASQQPLPFHPTPAEMPQLPVYCIARFAGNASPDYRVWEARLGPGFLHLHHYCAGLNYLNRYRLLLRDPQRGYYLSRIIPEMQYSFEHVGSSFPLMGEMHVNRGRAYALQKNFVAAVEDFNRAIKANPKNGYAYLELSRLQEVSGLRKEALDTVTRGMKHDPSNAALRKRYVELGGTS